MGERPHEEALAIPDARHGRGKRFGEQALRPFSVIVGIAVISFAIAVIIDSGDLSATATVLVIGLGLLARRAWKKADKATRDAFFFGYAEARGFDDPGLAELPPHTSLLRTGDHRQTGRLMAGRLDDHQTGLLGHFVYEEVAGKDDSERVIFHDFTVALIELAGVSERLGSLHFLAKSEDDEARDDRPVPQSQPLRLESIALARRYEMQTAPDIDQILIRRIFSPSFIVWLAEQPPDGFGFELEGNWLCCYQLGLQDSADGLDKLAKASAAVATRLADGVERLTLR